MSQERRLKQETMDSIGNEVREEYKAIVTEAELTLSRLDRISWLESRANAAPRAVTSERKTRRCREPEPA